MVDTGCKLGACGWSTAYTLDAYGWPVNGQTVGSMVKEGLLARDPNFNSSEVLDVTPAGRAALSPDTQEAEQ
ncbi:hypothetical protein [Xanthobacter flavus]|uniref:hypothetical protein n=1 Tax=Xanthobacter flavus TaxID=281 RepID=UPI003728C713